MMRLLGIVTAASVLLLLAPACGRRDEAGKRPPPSAADETLGRAGLLATIPEDVAAPEGAMPAGMPTHSPLAAGFTFVFGERGGGVAFVVEKGGLQQVIHNGRAGRGYSAVGTPVVSQDGRHCAYGALSDGRWRMVVDHAEGERTFDAVAAPAFSLDGAHLAWQAMDGERWYLVVDGRVNQGTATRYLQHELSADGAKIAFVEAVEGADRGRMFVSDVGFTRRAEVAAEVGYLVASEDRTRVAGVTEERGGARIVAVSFASPNRVERGPLYGAIQGVVLGADGAPPAYLAERSGKILAVLGDKEELLPPGDPVGPLVVVPGGKSLAALILVAGGVEVRGFFGAPVEREGPYEEAEGLAFSRDGKRHALAARKAGGWRVIVDGKAGPPFDRVVTPQLSPDGRVVVYRARQEGRRFVVVANEGGSVVATHPPHEQVFPAHLSSDGRAVAYGAKDGRQLLWKVEPL